MTGLVAAAENMPSGSAQRPGDVITHFGGRTVEVLNTDAEGRLVLADALAYADAVLRPGHHGGPRHADRGGPDRTRHDLAALFASDDRVAAVCCAAADASGDALWRMPLVDDYRDVLDSGVADLANMPHGNRHGPDPSRPRCSCASSAVGRRRAHLDIAGAGPVRRRRRRERPRAGTGFGTRVLLRWLAGL